MGQPTVVRHFYYHHNKKYLILLATKPMISPPYDKAKQYTYHPPRTIIQRIYVSIKTPLSYRKRWDYLCREIKLSWSNWKWNDVYHIAQSDQAELTPSLKCFAKLVVEGTEWAYWLSEKFASTWTRFEQVKTRNTTRNTL